MATILLLLSTYLINLILIIEYLSPLLFIGYLSQSLVQTCHSIVVNSSIILGYFTCLFLIKDLYCIRLDRSCRNWSPRFIKHIVIFIIIILVLFLFLDLNFGIECVCSNYQIHNILCYEPL